MKELAEKQIKIGFDRSPQKVVYDIEKTATEMAAQGWKLADNKTDEILGTVVLFFEREIPETGLNLDGEPK